MHRRNAGSLTMLGGAVILAAWAFNGWWTLMTASTGDDGRLLADIYWLLDAIGTALLMASYGLHRRRSRTGAQPNVPQHQPM
ncbi:hypothetical protein [Dactylosporangium sp. NPDC005555]|uniref:hypothetical protein n=1 Tax=Dactylosporangium sp. NPDC005555 TaxID=3154889 RepID=UPI0033A96048